MICLPSCDLTSLLEEVACYWNEVYALVNIVRGVQINKKEQYYLYIYIQSVILFIYIDPIVWDVMQEPISRTSSTCSTKSVMIITTIVKQELSKFNISEYFDVIPDLTSYIKLYGLTDTDLEDSLKINQIIFMG